MKTINNKTKRISAILLLIIGSALIITGSMVQMSFCNYTQDVVKDSNKDRNFILDTNLTTERFGNSYSLDEMTKSSFHYTDEEIKTYVSKKYKENVKAIFPIQLHDDQAALEGQKWKIGDNHGSGNLNRLSTSNPLLVQDFFSKGYTFEDKYDGNVPVLLPLQYLEDAEGRMLYDESAKNNFDFMRYAVDKYVGNSFDLIASNINNEAFGDPKADLYQDTGVKLIVVGIMPSSLGGYDNSLIVPDWTAEKVPALDFMNKYGSTSLVIEFNNSQSKDKAILASSLGQGFYAIHSLDGVTTHLSQRFVNIESGLLMFGAFCLMVAFVVLISLKESILRKVLLGVISVVIGLIISTTAVAILIKIFGNELYYSVAQYSSLYGDIAKPSISYIKFPLLQIISLFCTTIILGLISGFIGRKA